MHLEGGPQAPAAARASLAAFESYVDGDTLATARLLASELVSNCVVHGSAGDGDTLHFIVTVSNASLRVVVTDKGPGFVYTPGTPDPGRAGGWGLIIIERAASRWGTHDDGRSVWFELDHREAAAVG